MIKVGDVWEIKDELGHFRKVVLKVEPYLVKTGLYMSLNNTMISSTVYEGDQPFEEIMKAQGYRKVSGDDSNND